MKTVKWITWILVVVGAINWGLVGLFGFNLVDTLFGSVAHLGQIIYVLMGLSGVYMLFFCCDGKGACCK